MLARHLLGTKWMVGEKFIVSGPVWSRVIITAKASPDELKGPSLGGSAQATCVDSHFEIAVHEVLDPVSVTDSEGRLVRGLQLEEFRLLEDGVQQELKSILTEEVPLTVYDWYWQKPKDTFF